MNKYVKAFHEQMQEYAEQYSAFNDNLFKNWADTVRLVDGILSKSPTLRQVSFNLKLLTVGREYEEYSHAEKLADRIIADIQKSDAYKHERQQVRYLLMDLEQEMDRTHAEANHAENVLHDSVLANEIFEELFCFRDFYNSKAVARADCLDDTLGELAKMPVFSAQAIVRGMIRDIERGRRWK